MCRYQCLRAWVEEETEILRLRVEGTQIAAFVPVAAPAGERQIISLGLTAVLLGDHMINFVREEGNVRRKQTILAAIAGPLHD